MKTYSFYFWHFSLPLNSDWTVSLLIDLPMLSHDWLVLLYLLIPVEILYFSLAHQQQNMATYLDFFFLHVLRWWYKLGVAYAQTYTCTYCTWCIPVHAHNSVMEKYALENQQPLFHFYALHHLNPSYISVDFVAITYIGKYGFLFYYNILKYNLETEIFASF